MGACRAGYMLALTVAVGLWLLNGTQFSAFWLKFLLLAPWLSLLLSLASICSFTMKPRGCRYVTMGRRGQIMLLGTCPWPMPPFRGRLRLIDEMTGKRLRYDPEAGIPTEHCGGFRAELCRGRVCDYLGLWAFPPRGGEAISVTVLPDAVPIAHVPDFRSPPVHRYAAGGDSPEEYELCAYRRGDSPKSLHWKLSFKTGHPIVRRLRRPEAVSLTVDMIARGSRDELDRKYGQLLWLGKHLCSLNISHRLRVLTGRGVQVFSVSCEADVRRALTVLLHCPPAGAGERLPALCGQWHYMPEDTP